MPIAIPTYFNQDKSGISGIFGIGNSGNFGASHSGNFGASHSGNSHSGSFGASHSGNSHSGSFGAYKHFSQNHPQSFSFSGAVFAGALPPVFAGDVGEVVTV